MALLIRRMFCDLKCRSVLERKIHALIFFRIPKPTSLFFSLLHRQNMPVVSYICTPHIINLLSTLTFKSNINHICLQPRHGIVWPATCCDRNCNLLILGCELELSNILRCDPCVSWCEHSLRMIADWPKFIGTMLHFVQPQGYPASSDSHQFVFEIMTFSLSLLLVSALQRKSWLSLHILKGLQFLLQGQHFSLWCQCLTLQQSHIVNTHLNIIPC